MTGLKYCRDCIHAKPRTDYLKVRMWYCPKHRRFITEHSCVSVLTDKDCKDYQERGGK